VVHRRCPVNRPIGRLVLCVLVFPTILLVVLWWPMRYEGPWTSTDFMMLYGTGKIVRDGAAAHIYDYQYQLAAQQTFTSHADAMPFNHPPFEALLYAPLAYLSFSKAYFAWLFCNLSILGLIFLLLSRYGVVFGSEERPVSPQPRSIRFSPL
jgi:hypothetical protein